jgi:hypothetical protein
VRHGQRQGRLGVIEQVGLVGDVGEFVLVDRLVVLVDDDVPQSELGVCQQGAGVPVGGQPSGGVYQA